jgi:hypothetical protein
VNQVILTVWRWYYTALWSLRLYVWNPLRSRVDRGFDEADWQVRIRVDRLLKR